MERAITGLRQDDAGEWVAELSCGHARHVRDAPPFAERAWTRTPEGRAARIGTPLACGRCDARELPAGHVEYRRTATFTESTAPAALRARHETKPGVWGRIHVASGSLGYRIFAPFDSFETLGPGDSAVVLPEVAHRVEIDGPVEFCVAFWRREAPR